MPRRRPEASRRPLRRWTFHPRLETLEDRTLPALSPLTLAEASLWGMSGTSSSSYPSLSADGQLVVFESDAPNLVANDFNNASDVFLYHRATGQVEMLSGNRFGTGSANSNSTLPQISADGRYAIFLSEATDLTAEAIINGGGHPDLYLRDLLNDTTTLLSISTTGTGCNGGVDFTQITPDGKFVLFRSDATNLISGDTNGQVDLFRRDVAGGTTVRVSVGSGLLQGTGEAMWGWLTPDGRYLAFQSRADNLVPEDSNNGIDVFWRDITADQTKLVSIDKTGSLAGMGNSVLGGDAYTYVRTISDDGRYVVFESDARNLVTPDIGFSTNIFLRDVVAGQTKLVSITANGSAATNGFNPTITANGRYVGFISTGTGQDAAVTDTNGVLDAFVYDRVAGSTRMASVSTTGNTAGNATSGTGQYQYDFAGGFPLVSEDGRYAVFASEAMNLATGATDGNNGQSSNVQRRDVFRRDFQLNVTRQVSLNGTAGGDSGSFTPAVSSDFRYIAFESNANNLFSGDNNRFFQDIFLRDMTAGTTQLASRRFDAYAGQYLAEAGGELRAVTPDGRYAVFTSYSSTSFSDLAPNVPVAFGWTRLFRRDRLTGTITPVDLQPNGTFNAGGNALQVSISPDGRYVAFSHSNNTLDGSVTGTAGGFYLRDTQSDTTTMISRNTVSGTPANTGIHGSAPVVFSPDGRFIAFVASATNLINGVTVPGGQFNLYLYDRNDSSLRMMSRSSGGTASGNGSTGVTEYQPVFSADSSRLAFVSRSSDLVSGVTDANSHADVFYADLTGAQAFQVQLVSHSTTLNTAGNNGSGDSVFYSPTLSANGRYVAFGSRASNLTAEANNSQPQIFVRDLQLNTTQLVSFRSDNTAGGNNSSFNPVISADGTRVLFESNASNLTALGTSSSLQLYVRDLGDNTTQMVSVNAAGTSGGNSHSGHFGNGDETRPYLTPDGRYAVFASQATNLINGFVDGNAGGYDLYLRDLQTGQTQLLTWNVSGNASGNLGISANHQLFLVATGGGALEVLLESPAGDLLRGDRNNDADVFVYRHAGLGTISGTLFTDVNGNGVRDGGDNGRQYWTVYLDANGNGLFEVNEDNVETDASGNFTFRNLAAGNYTVRAVTQYGFGQTLPGGSGSYAVNLPTDTSSVTGRDFGMFAVRPDIETTTVTFNPGSAQPGQTVTVNWTVRNNDINNVTGDWTDAIFLSTDNLLDAGDILLGTFAHVGGLSGQASYNGSGTVTLPGVVPGNYRLIVSADRRFQVNADTNRANNVAAAASQLGVTLPTLAPGFPVGDAFTGPEQFRYFQMTVEPGESLRLLLDSAVNGGATELYVRLGQMPTPAEFDFASRLNVADQHLTIPHTQPGVYYILARSRHGAAATSNFSINAFLTGFDLESIDRASGGNTGSVTLAVHGSKFTAATQVQLVSGATTINTSSIDFRDGSLLYATFNLGNQTVGTYDVKAIDGVNNDTLAGAFTIQAGVVNPIEVNLLTPRAVRAGGRQSSVVVEYTNTGNTDVTAPLFQLVANGARLRLSPDEELAGNFTDSRVQFLGIAADGPAGVLRPGQGGQARVYFVNNPAIPDYSINFTVTMLAQESLTLDWNTRKEDLQPEHFSDDAWDAVFANFLTQVGTTTQHYQTLLAANATYLSQLGIRTGNANELLSFELAQANAFQYGSTLMTRQDAALATSGLGLRFGAASLQTLAGRHRLGAMGRGWVHDWEIQAERHGNGDVTLIFGEARRGFVRQANGSYRGAEDDFGTLTFTGNSYRLREPDGTVFQFRTDDRLSYMEDANGNRITAGYDGSGRLTSLTHSSGGTLTISYNPQGRISQVNDGVGRISTYTYDVSGEHLLSVSDEQGTRQYQYLTGQGLAREHALSQVTNLDGTHFFFTYDAQGRIIGSHLDGNANARTISYDAFAGVTTTDANNATTQVLYNHMGDVEIVRDPLGRVTQYDYGHHGQLTRAVSPTGLTFQYQHDERGNIVRTVDPLGQEVKLSYGAAGTLNSLTDARGNKTQYAYDGNNNLQTITYADNSQKQFLYDPLGNLTRSTNRRGRAINNQYNARGQVTRKDFQDGSFQTFAYDARGNLTSALDSVDGTTTLTYDSADRLDRVDLPGGRFLNFTYDAGGRRTQSVDQDGFTVKYLYNAAGRLFELRDGSDALLAQYTYDAAGRLGRLDNGNSTFTTYGYDLAGQLLSLVNRQADNTVNSQFDYTYDGEGRRTSMTTAGGTTNYEYDALGQLAKVTLPGGRTLRYLYDATGNRTQVIDSQLGTTNYVANNLNQITSAGNATYTYDADGNLLTATDPGGTTTYTWDDQNQLVAVSGPGGTFSYEYNPFGQRTAAVRGGVRTEYLFDPAVADNLVGAYTGGTTVNYVHGLGLVNQVNAGTAAYYDFDANGNTVGLTDASGAYLNWYSYLPFGETTTLQNTLANPFTFVGQGGVQQEADGFLNMRFRNYSTATGQFASEDPIGFAAGDFNTRRYVNNQPVSHSDPSGLVCYIAVGGYLGGPPTAVSVTTYYSSDGRVFQTVGGGAGTLGASVYLGFGSGSLSEGFGHSASITPVGIPGGGFTGNASIDPASSKATSMDGGLSLGYSATGGSYTAGTTTEYTIPGYKGFPCPLPWAPPPTPDFPGAFKHVLKGLTGIVFSSDPNDITGPNGFGEAGYIRAGLPMPYTIRFENQQSATAPAQEVFITHQLDADLDWTTFMLADFGFGSMTIDVPDGLQFYSTRINTANPDDSPLFVDVEAGINLETGLASWTFRSVDPLTGDLPEDAFAGFLPPNDPEDHRGEGFVNYVVRQKNGLTTGTKITQQARIIFDTNAPIDTNIFLNTIDAGTPTSMVQPLAALNQSLSFSVSWNGTDDVGGSGIVGYDVYVSDNGGAWSLWQDNTAAKTATFTGLDLHTYAFKVRAVDGAGNRQADPGVAQASTQVVLPPVALDDVYGVTKGINLVTTTTNGLLFNDVKLAGRTLTAQLVTGPTKGLLTLNANGAFTYRPGATFDGLDSFTYRIRDNTGRLSNIATVTLATQLVNFRLVPISINEVAGTYSLWVDLRVLPTVTTTVDYSVLAQTAQAGVDFNLVNGTLTFNPGQKSKAITFTMLHDLTDEVNETFQVNLSNPTNAVLGKIRTNTVTITDNDAPPVVQFRLAGSSGDEGTNPANLEVFLSAASSKAVTINYKALSGLTGGTALGNGTDFTLANGTLTFNPGETSKVIPLALFNDALDEKNETVKVQLSAPTNAALGLKAVHTFTILDNDPTPTVSFTAATSSASEAAGTITLTVTLSAASALNITVSFAVTGGTATKGGVDYGFVTLPPLTFTAGQTSKTITVRLINDTRDEPDETAQISLASPVNALLGPVAANLLTILDND